MSIVYIESSVSGLANGKALYLIENSEKFPDVSRLSGLSRIEEVLEIFVSKSARWVTGMTVS
jgi:hypothetical protein